MWGHFRRKSSKSQEWFLPATCPQVTSDASNLLRHVPWAFDPDYCLFGFASIGLQSSFCQKKCQKEQKVPFFWPPKILYSFGESKKRPFIVILSPIPFGSCQNVSNATWAYRSYAKLFIFAGENRLGAKKKRPFSGKKGKFWPKKARKIEKNDFFKKVAENSAGNMFL